MQSMSVLLGGSMYQNMWHETNPQDDGTKIMHTVALDPRLLDFAPKDMKPDKKGIYHIGVNSRHHQTIKEESLKDTGLQIVGRHSIDNHVEIIAHDSLPIVGYQCHPEDIYDRNTYVLTNNIINYLIKTKSSIL